MSKKIYCVDVDFVMSRTLEVSAENEEQAKSLADSLIDAHPYEYACNFSHMVGHKIIDAYEQD